MPNEKRNAILEKVITRILNEPTCLSMSDWLMPDAKTPCGTVGCIAGWALVEGGLVKTTDDLRDIVWTACDQAKALLELDKQEAASLFFVPNWPDKFYQRYYDCFNFMLPRWWRKKRQAKVAAARIRHFIKTGE